MKHSVFISYRREGGEGFAQMFSEKLSKKHYRVFYDIESIGAGMFDQRILREIEQTDVFLLILTKDALNRCKNEGDWVRCEITHALSLGKTIIPLFFRGFEFPENLPQDIARVALYNGIDIRDMNFFDTKFKQLCSMIDAAAKKSHSSANHREAKPSNSTTPAIQTKPAAPSVALSLPESKGNATLAREYYFLARKPRIFKKFVFSKAKYVCMYKSDYYYLLAAELGHKEALQYIVDHKIPTYKPNLSAFSYQDGSLNYTRVKFLAVRSTIHFFFSSESLDDSSRVIAYSKITNQLDELARLSYIPAQMVLYHLYSGGHGAGLYCTTDAANWFYKNKHWKRPTEASRVAAQLEKKGIIV